MTPKVSIIIPNYNHVNFIQQRLDSVFNQTVQDFEVILLDDASSDSSEQVLLSYKNHPKVSHIIINNVNSGSPFKQWEKGIKLAVGEYIWIAESDDFCELNFLETCLKNKSDNSQICYVQSVDVDELGDVLKDRISYTKEFNPNIWEDNFSILGIQFVEKYLLKKNVIPNASAVLFKRKLIKPDLFNKELTSMKMCGDWFFWIKLIYHTDITFINKKLNYFRNHSEVSRNHYDLHKQKQRVLEEVVIREFLFKNHKLEDKTSVKKMQKKWFNAHKKNEFLDKSFYKISEGFLSKASLFYNFVVFKIKSL
ncbi:glycosyltransferase family 2 protein [Winogradskyella sp. F6397]|uniref:Glycosyltransferase family 2 protein n=1 Tax=Winogradskyella marina TaxID=2785530 RepID=A0ABS0EKJ5_9FLAO|nr:glycosyltransferase family 2 protein [Winogradskyella marina]MBF8150979.1 glycosyltransferase family 2 protein [Winogradskyella marina]